MAPAVKKTLLVLLVVIVVVTGLPVLMGMSGMATCDECGPALAPACLAAVLAAGVALMTVLHGRRPRVRRVAVPRLLHSFLLERPPRFA